MHGYAKVHNFFSNFNKPQSGFEFALDGGNDPPSRMQCELTSDWTLIAGKQLVGELSSQFGSAEVTSHTLFLPPPCSGKTPVTFTETTAVPPEEVLGRKQQPADEQRKK